MISPAKQPDVTKKKYTPNSTTSKLAVEISTLTRSINRRTSRHVASLGLHQRSNVTRLVAHYLEHAAVVAGKVLNSPLRSLLDRFLMPTAVVALGSVPSTDSLSLENKRKQHVPKNKQTDGPHQVRQGCKKVASGASLRRLVSSQ